MEKKPRIAIDMDEVIADTPEKIIKIYKEKHGLEITQGMLSGKAIREALPDELKHTLSRYLNEKGFFRDIPVISDSQRVVEELNKKYDVFIVSAAMEFKNSLIDKYEWLNEYFPFINWTNIIFCGLKIVNVDIFIDDRSRNFAGFDGRKMLFSAHHNVNEKINYERVDTWNQVADSLL